LLFDFFAIKFAFAPLTFFIGAFAFGFGAPECRAIFRGTPFRIIALLCFAETIEIDH
jgi:hypothetical protein